MSAWADDDEIMDQFTEVVFDKELGCGYKRVLNSKGIQLAILIENRIVEHVHKVLTTHDNDELGEL